MRFFLGLFFLLTTFCYAGEIDWTPENRPPIRPSIQECKTFLAPADPTVNESVGVLLSNNTALDFERQLDKLIAERGMEAVRGGRFYVTGVPMGKEKETQRKFELVLQERGLLEVTRVSVLSVPTRKVRQLIGETTCAVWERLKYFMPSFARDYQKPLKSEVSSGIASDIAVEIPNVVFLYHTLNGVDFGLTAGIHTALILAYNIYTKSMLNWLLRPGTGRVEEFLKSAALSFPFVLNYAVFGNFSKIYNFFLEHGWEATATQFPAELANFGTTQGLTLFLQVMFYRIVVTNGIGAWINNQKGDQDSSMVRTVANIVRTPVLALDAIALAMAGANAAPLMSMGPFDFNNGHVALIGLTATGAILWLKPTLLDPTLRWYKALLTVGKSLSSYFWKEKK